jgi:hypothetical protein
MTVADVKSLEGNRELVVGGERRRMWWGVGEGGVLEVGEGRGVCVEHLQMEQSGKEGK